MELAVERKKAGEFSKRNFPGSIILTILIQLYIHLSYYQ